MLRDYQIKISEKAAYILHQFHIVYLAIEMRVGKTLISMDIANRINAKNVLFITKKKAISSIESDFKKSGYKFNITVINYEQLNKLKPEYDLIIADEAHVNKAYPKPSNKTKILKHLVGKNNLILLSGTPTPESYSEIFHQFWLSDYTPFPHKNFYRWADEYVKVKDKIISQNIKIKDYSNADRNKIMKILEPYFIRFSQNDAGFQQSEVIEEVIEISVDYRIPKLIQTLVKDKIYYFKDNESLICDSAVKLQNKIHQICSGTVICESGNRKILDISKAEYIKNNYKNKKIAVFYKFQAEGDVLKEHLTNYTENSEEFNQSDLKTYISQIQSGSMGVNLSSADVLIFYNIDFSAMQYWQARARIQNFTRETPPIVHWLFSGYIEKKIYEAVINKKNYTNVYFRKDFIDAGEDYSKENFRLFKTA